MSFPFFRRRPKPAAVIGSDDAAAIELGRYKNNEQIGSKLRYGGGRAVVICGANRVGKDSRILINNLLSSTAMSWLVVDPRGEATAVTAPFRRTLGPVRILNPFGVHIDTPGYHDLASDGCGFLSDLDAASSLFFDLACGKGEALIKPDPKDPHWGERAQEAATGLAMDEVMQADREARIRSLFRIRMALTEAATFDKKSGAPLTGLQAHARRALARGTEEIKSLLGQFAEEDISDELRSVLSNAARATRWILSPPMRADMAKDGIKNFAELGDRICTYYVILPHEFVETHAIWLRLVVQSALRANYRARPDGPRIGFILNEFAALGRLREVEMAQGLTAGFGIQLIPVLQSLTQLKLHYEDGWENFLGQAGAVVGLGVGDDFSAEWMSKRSGETTIRNPSANMNQNNSGLSQGTGEGYTRVRYLMPQDFYGLEPGHAHIWCAGEAKPIPAYLPSYWDIETLARRARRNPFYAR